METAYLIPSSRDETYGLHSYERDPDRPADLIAYPGKEDAKTRSRRSEPFIPAVFRNPRVPSELDAGEGPAVSSLSVEEFALTVWDWDWLEDFPNESDHWVRCRVYDEEDGILSVFFESDGYWFETLTGGQCRRFLEPFDRRGEAGTREIQALPIAESVDTSANPNDPRELLHIVVERGIRYDEWWTYSGNENVLRAFRNPTEAESVARELSRDGPEIEGYNGHTDRFIVVRAAIRRGGR